MKRERRDAMKKKKKVRRKRNEEHENTRLFPLLLATLCSRSRNRETTLIGRYLDKLVMCLPDVQLSPILSLFPSILKINDAGIVCKCIEIIGAASLQSLEMNEQIASEVETVKCVVSLLGSSEREIAVASCNTVLDLSTTSVGRERLLELSVIEMLLLCLIQVSETTASRYDVMFSEDDEYQTLLLQAAISLINSCTMEKLHHIPDKLSENFLTLLRNLFDKAHEQSLCIPSSRRNQGHNLLLPKISINNLSECIFRLSVIFAEHLGQRDSYLVEKSIFGSGEVSVEQFISEMWETSPVHVRDASKASLIRDSSFSPFIQCLGPEETTPTYIPSMLKSLISCPAIASDELDILRVINDIKNQLGDPIIYNQDIRVVKTESGKTESHYFQKQSPHVFDLNDILKCEEALENGYSIALRGMEFRFQKIATIADELASLFGQPSTGVNMYLTPPNAQGLARHSDDHCVFVCQLVGVKRWKIYPRSDVCLPRLYESNGYLSNLAEDDSWKVDDCFEILLKEGDILYIPRGFPHEAHTSEDDCGDVTNTTGSSLHLTLAVEIEPPFEWEGFIQIALHVWGKEQITLESTYHNPVTRNLHVLAMKLLHVAIKSLGIQNPKFRKACLVGAAAAPSSSETKDWIFRNQRATFESLLSVIMSESNFSQVAKHIEVSVQRDEDPLDYLQWMNHLDTETKRSFCLSFSHADFCTLMQYLETAEAVFSETKSKFCHEVEFEDVRKCYQVLLDKYRKVRKQYANGMLSLHCAVNKG